jgi:hypothetical protein
MAETGKITKVFTKKPGQAGLQPGHDTFDKVEDLPFATSRPGASVQLGLQGGANVRSMD